MPPAGRDLPVVQGEFGFVGPLRLHGCPPVSASPRASSHHLVARTNIPDGEMPVKDEGDVGTYGKTGP